MKKKWEVRYIVTAVASIPVYKTYGKTEAYRHAAKDGWGTVYRDENNALVCDEDCSANLYTKNGGYFGIFPYEEIDTKEMPKQAACAAIIVSDSCGFTFWAEDFNQIHIFVTYEESGLIDTYRIEYGAGAQTYDGETEISFEDLAAEEAWRKDYRAEIPGTIEYQHKQEAAEVAAQAAATVLAYMDDLGVARCGECGAELLCSGTGDMPDVCPACGRRLEYDFFREPEGPDADEYRTRADNQQEAGTAAEAASEGQKTALGTPEAMAGTDATAEEKRRKKRKKKPP